MDITPEIVRELLHYDPETGVITCKIRGRHWFKSERAHKWWNSRYAGRRVGWVWTNPRTGYQNRQLKILGRIRYEHHLAWMWMTDEPLPPQIDHENRDGTDNRWCNLRASTNAENHRNQSMYRNSTSGVTGVTWDKQHEKWRAQCGLGGRVHYLGLFAELDEAALAASEFRAANGFDPGHGMEVAHYHARAQKP